MIIMKNYKSSFELKIKNLLDGDSFFVEQVTISKLTSYQCNKV